MALFFSYFVVCQLATYEILFLRLDVTFSLVNKGASEKYLFSLTVATHVAMYPRVTRKKNANLHRTKKYQL
jgi:hypothetical protein